jgi:HEXXH motif-containing protein
MRAHTVPAEQLDALAAGGGGAAAMQNLRAAQLSKRLLLLRAVADAATEHRPELYAGSGAADSMALLAAAHEVAPGPVTELLRHPFLDAWATRCLGLLLAGRRDADDVLHGDLAHLGGYAVVAAARAGLDAPVRLPVHRSTVVLPALGQLDRRAAAPLAYSRRGAVHVRVGVEEVRVDPGGHSRAPGWLPLRRLAATASGRRLDVVVDDLDPYRDRFGSPVATRLGPARFRALGGQLEQAWRMLVNWHPQAAAELGAAELTLVPLAPPDDGHAVSGASRHSFGAIGSSLPDAPEFFAELLLHEMAHVKLGGLLDIMPLYRDSTAGMFRAPWREDPRPAGALLQGAYAHLTVARFWHVQRRHPGEIGSDAADERFALVREQSADAIRTLGTALQLTEAGRRFLREMATASDDLYRDPVPAQALRLAREAVRSHHDRWRRQHGSAQIAGTR